jgi:cyclopropane-fatty-acyl-phospholipid synthase
MPEATDTKDMRPHFEEIQAHYDLSDDFFGLFQDSTRKYSCAYFTGPERHPVRAQVANVDQHLDWLDLKPGMTLLEVGCGWGLTLQRDGEYDVNVIGLTLSKNQKAYCDQLLSKVDSERTFDVRLEGWEQFHPQSTGSCRSRRSNTSGSNATTTSSRTASTSCPTTAG